MALWLCPFCNIVDNESCNKVGGFGNKIASMKQVLAYLNLQ